ncbi:MAG: VOC family protein [Acidobacteriota bacterium]
MKFTFAHNNINVLHLEKSLIFYKSALDLVEVRRRQAEDGSFTLVFLGDGTTPHRLELTYLRDRREPYDLGDNEIHLAFTVDDFGAALAKHQEMGIVCFENPSMGIYFIEDPDGYWIEILPEKR